MLLLFLLGLLLSLLHPLTAETEVWTAVGSKIVVGEPRTRPETSIDYTTLRVAVSGDGDRLVVYRVERADGGAGNYTGQVISYELAFVNGTQSTLDWMPTATLDFPENSFFIRPFLAMAGDGSRMVVGADDVEGYKPQVYEWTASESHWRPVGRDLGDVAGLQGRSLDGLSMNEDGSRVAMGHGSYIRVFDYDATSDDWIEQDNRIAFGHQVRCMSFSASGDRLVVGLYSDEALVMANDPTTLEWSLVALVSLIVQGNSPSDTSWFGYDCDISSTETRIVVEAPKSGLARVYDQQAGTTVNEDSYLEWGLVGEIIGVPGAQLGNSVAFSKDGRRVAAAMGMADFVQVYSENEDPSNKTWSTTGQTIPCVYRPLFGPGRVALSNKGDRVVVGQSNTFGGHVDVLDCLGCSLASSSPTGTPVNRPATAPVISPVDMPITSPAARNCCSRVSRAVWLVLIPLTLTMFH